MHIFVIVQVDKIFRFDYIFKKNILGESNKQICDLFEPKTKSSIECVFIILICLRICSTIDLYCRFSKDVGHYTAMVWSNTNKIGCGITEFRDGKWFAKLYTCNYGPAGNYIGGQMYAKGRACTQCPSGTSCSVQYPGLCGKL